MRERDERFEVARSTIEGAGEGLFARVRLGVGERLEVVGVTVQEGSVEAGCTRYADPYKYRLGEQTLIPIGFGAMVNHSVEGANVEKEVEGGRLFLRVVQEIPRGGEVLLCYGSRAIEMFKAR